MGEQWCCWLRLVCGPSHWHCRHNKSQRHFAPRMWLLVVWYNGSLRKNGESYWNCEIAWCLGDSVILPSGKLSHNYGKSPLFMGKLTISMAIFHSYVKLPDSTSILPAFHVFFPWKAARWLVEFRARTRIHHRSSLDLWSSTGRSYRHPGRFSRPGRWTENKQLQL